MNTSHTLQALTGAGQREPTVRTLDFNQISDRQGHTDAFGNFTFNSVIDQNKI